MPITLKVRDETGAGTTLNVLTLDFLTEQITVRELIRSRVYQEVKDFNVSVAQSGAAPRAFRGLVQPGADEVALNAGSRVPKTAREIDWKKQFEVALEAFEGNGFVILVGEQQVRGLEDVITLKAGTEVSFVKLTPLVGG